MPYQKLDWSFTNVKGDFHYLAVTLSSDFIYSFTDRRGVSGGTADKDRRTQILPATQWIEHGWHKKIASELDVNFAEDPPNGSIIFTTSDGETKVALVEFKMIVLYDETKEEDRQKTIVFQVIDLGLDNRIKDKSNYITLKEAQGLKGELNVTLFWCLWKLWRRRWWYSQ